MRWIAQPHSVCTAGMEMMGMLGATRIGRYVPILLADLMTKLVEVDQLKMSAIVLP
jgi:hypothetical protein